MTRSRKLTFDTCVEHFGMLTSTSMRIDGLWLGVLGEKKEELQVLTEALDLIRTFDPLRYRRIKRDLRRIWLTILHGAVGQYSEATATCKIDQRYAFKTYPAAVALTIVHEATHARLRRFGYPPEKRQRIEKVCIRRELAFAKRLPEYDVLVEWVENRLRTPFDYSPENLMRLRKSGELEWAKESDIPLWFVTAGQKFREWRWGLRSTHP